MGWCRECGNIPEPNLNLFDVDNDENSEQYEKYLEYLKNDRKLSDGTMIEHVTSAIFALKFLFARYNLDIQQFIICI